MRIFLLSLVVGGVILASFRGTDSLEDTSLNINDEECIRSVKSVLYSSIANNLRIQAAEKLKNFEDDNIKAITSTTMFGSLFDSVSSSLKKSIKSVKSSVFGSQFEESANNLKSYKSRCKSYFSKIDDLKFKIEIENNFKKWFFNVTVNKGMFDKKLEFTHNYFELITMNEFDIFLSQKTKTIFNEIFPKIFSGDDSKASQK